MDDVTGNVKRNSISRNEAFFAKNIRVPVNIASILLAGPIDLPMILDPSGSEDFFRRWICTCQPMTVTTDRYRYPNTGRNHCQIRQTTFLLVFLVAVMHLPWNASEASSFVLAFNQNRYNTNARLYQVHKYPMQQLEQGRIIETFSTSSLRSIVSPPSSESSSDQQPYVDLASTDKSAAMSSALPAFKNETLLQWQVSNTSLLPFITPYQILHSDSFPINVVSTTTGGAFMTKEMEQSFSGYDQILSLHSALSLIRKCLRTIVDTDGDDGKTLERILNQASVRPQKGVSSISSKTMPLHKIVRIEHQVYTTSIDPLAWLRRQFSVVDNKDCLLYLCTHERDTEVAVIGSAIVVNNTQDLWDLFYGNESEPDSEGFSGCNLLPTNSYWYGGARFDPLLNHSQTANNDWTAFGGANWILPAVELLVKRVPRSSLPTLDGIDFTTNTVATLAVHLVASETSNHSWRSTARELLQKLERLDAQCAAKAPPTILPPILSRGNALHHDTSTGSTNMFHSQIYRSNAQDLYEDSVTQALKAFQHKNESTTKRIEDKTNDLADSILPTIQPKQVQPLEKVVLARQQVINFGTTFTALDVIRRWKYGGHEGGHLFYMRPDCNNIKKRRGNSPEFFGCTPERLFAVKTDSGLVTSEALAGTRPRGSTQQEDEVLLRDLFASPKERRENRLTGLYIEKAFDYVREIGLITKRNDNISAASTRSSFMSDDSSGGAESSTAGFFVRRLLHLQHICQRYSAKIVDRSKTMEIVRLLLSKLHPTPAVCGVPMDEARDFIRRYESISFDRGFYSGPFGYIGQRSTDILVALRCGLTTSTPVGTTTVTSFAGAGIVSGSTVQGEWAETNYKFAVISSLFPQSPLSFRGAPTANVAWSTAFVAELIRNGVTRFYVCPGSRSTPLVSAIAKAVRSNVGVVHAVSIHDERCAGFRAVGYSRGTGKLAAVLTSSGTAVANLYPAVVEAGMDGVPMLLLTGDRPYECRATGANQAIDQIKTFSDTYIRWFRDILPPDDEIPVSLALSDACHAVHLAKELRGPVHINVQFRENLAPDGGPIRGDSRALSVTRFNEIRFVDVPGFDRWSTGGNTWSNSYSRSIKSGSLDALRDVASLIQQSKRGIIVVGNLRSSTQSYVDVDQAMIAQTISDFAKAIGFPIIAGAQSANLRFMSSAVVLFSDNLLKCRIIAENLQPDLVIQIGAPLVSTAVPEVLMKALKASNKLSYVLVHPHTPQERADPSLMVTHTIPSEISPFLNGVLDYLSSNGSINECGSQLAPLVLLGRMLQLTMKKLIFEATEYVVSENEKQNTLSEPQVVVALSEHFSKLKVVRSLFLSNSMPIRDAELFFYPMTDSFDPSFPCGPISVGTNRGASGIDGIISTALGYSESMATPTTLVIGDVAALHDIGSFHSVANSGSNQSPPSGKKRNALATVIVNNNGGGIFSFLPIARHGNEVGFDEFFGTPTSSFSFKQGIEAFGLHFDVASNYESFYRKYEEALELEEDTIVEARVLCRSANVAVHQKIASDVESYITRLLIRRPHKDLPERLPVKMYRQGTSGSTTQTEGRTMVLLHGWMGDKLEWHETAKLLSERLDADWTIYSVDLPGHGGAPLQIASTLQAVRSSLCLLDDEETDFMSGGLSVDCMAEDVLKTLSMHQHLQRVDAVAGYSAGGRVALAMKRLCAALPDDTHPLITSDTAMILLGVFPGHIQYESTVYPNDKSAEDTDRIRTDDNFANEITMLCDKACLSASDSESKLLMDGFLKRWYSNDIWSSLTNRDKVYQSMVEKRSRHLINRGRDIALALSHCSPPKCNEADWQYCLSEKTLFIAGEMDMKYKRIGKMLQKMDIAQYEEVVGSSHALLVEAPSKVAEIMATFLNQNCSLSSNSLFEDKFTEIKFAHRLSETSSDQSAPPPVWTLSVDGITAIDSIEYETFTVNIIDEDKSSAIFGVGWEENAKAGESGILHSRSGLIVQITSSNGLMSGVGEVSPLTGLHKESLIEAEGQVQLLRDALRNLESDDLPYFEAERVLALDGSLGDVIARLTKSANIDSIFPSVRSGLEMALISLAAQHVSFPVHQALTRYAIQGDKIRFSGLLPLCGFISRKLPAISMYSKLPSSQRSFKSIKVKVGYQDCDEDKASVLQGFQRIGLNLSGRNIGRIRVDANRAWNESQVVAFATSLEGLDVHALEKIEYIEEPLKTVKKANNNSLGSNWTLDMQVSALERSFFQTSLPYALDESLVDLVTMRNFSFDSIKDTLEEIFKEDSRGCAALILKPSLIGFELSLQIARLARRKLGMGAVFSSSFDSGLGLAHTAFLSNVADRIESSTVEIYPHGLGTFTLLKNDTITPPFSSYVNEDGILNIPSLSRALFGLSLEDIRDSKPISKASYPALKKDAFGVDRNIKLVSTDADWEQRSKEEKMYEASTATSSSGTEISVVVSLPLPFSADTAWSRFTDLPSMSRWSPWITSVRYQGLEETEWMINVRGIPLKWRATSQLINEPCKGIQWQSVSGLSNRGIVEFISDDTNKDNGDSYAVDNQRNGQASSCVMNVRMTLTPPRLFRPFFQGTSTLFLEEFLRDKLLKWSLEMFRDVVKADLALERYVFLL
jgi:2-succinyl-5-enolpyruvyl-6-hydroxy-3-cyclohexene-1-carboxylate synthase